jgi:hypothetical protein
MKLTLAWGEYVGAGGAEKQRRALAMNIKQRVEDVIKQRTSRVTKRKRLTLGIDLRGVERVDELHHVTRQGFRKTSQPGRLLLGGKLTCQQGEA